jgi:hypothetical protein
MIAASIPFRRTVQILAIAALLALPRVALAQCAGISEEGRWKNLDNNGEPSYIDVKMLGGCGDQVLNGVATGSAPHYTLRVWVKQSTGKMYGRPTVNAVYRTWLNKKWLQGNVSTGGYVDQMGGKEPRKVQTACSHQAQVFGQQTQRSIGILVCEI